MVGVLISVALLAPAILLVALEQETEERWARSPGGEHPSGGGHGNPLQYSCLENSMDRGAWGATVHEVTKSQIRLKRLFTFLVNSTMLTKTR